ncbi:MAG: hypothetical protein JWM63_4195, partial [Gammaproteobacteria bacterium]|nr:hypothetical protein [Gammaproteobacteria bacterium]
FDAERLRRGRGLYGTVTRLAPDASNLPEVLQNLQADRDRYSEYLALVAEVLPDVQNVIVVPLSQNEQEVRVSSLRPSMRRGDLAVPLLRTGSGVAQVLAILYVVVTTDSPHVLLIDEPNSFLHPQASRTLIKILKRFPKHQYIIATHSPEVMSEIGSAATVMLEWEREQSAATQFEGGDSRTSSVALALVGARLSDVFGYDRVIWCEGPSDVYCFRLILSAFFPSHEGTVLVPVHSTGAFDKRRRQETIDIYRQLSKASALVPPTVGFLFDAEDRTQAQRADLERLQSAAVREWLDANIASRAYAHGEITPESIVRNPIEWTHGKRLLDDAIVHFTEGRHSFVNTRDVEPLTRVVLEERREQLRPLAELLGELIGAEPDS